MNTPNTLRLATCLCTAGLLVRGRPRGTWRSSLYEYALVRDWLPGVDLAALQGRELRLRHRLHGRDPGLPARHHGRHGRDPGGDGDDAGAVEDVIFGCCDTVGS